MRKLFVFLCVGFIACAAKAEPRWLTIDAALGDATTLTQTVDNVRGYIDTVYVTVSDGASTGTVTLASVSLDSGADAVTLVSRSVTNTAVFRPRVDGTDSAGTALSSDPPWRYPLAGDSLRLTISGSPTGVTWQAGIVTDR